MSVILNFQKVYWKVQPDSARRMYAIQNAKLENASKDHTEVHETVRKKQNLVFTQTKFVYIWR